MSISKERLDDLERHLEQCRRFSALIGQINIDDYADLISAARRLAEVEAERDELRVLDEENTAKITELVRSGVEGGDAATKLIAARAKELKTERDALQLLTDQRLKQIEDLEGGPALSEIIRNLKAERDEWKTRCMDTDAMINTLKAERDRFKNGFDDCIKGRANANDKIIKLQEALYAAETVLAKSKSTTTNWGGKRPAESTATALGKVRECLK